MIVKTHSEDGGSAFVVAEPVLRRSYDADAANALINDPDIRPFVGGQGHLDLSEVVSRPEHWLLLGDHGGFLLSWSAPGVHEVHTFILRSGRGQWAWHAARSMINFAVDHGDIMLWTRIRPEMRNVAAFARSHGMRPTGQSVETFGEPHEILKMELH